MCRTAGQSASSIARIVTPFGGSGRFGRSASAPITTSAACGSATVHASLTATIVAVPALRSSTKPTSASFFTWCEQVA
jgi:hypothetical protein